MQTGHTGCISAAGLALGYDSIFPSTFCVNRLIFLKENGKLEEFVEAKLLGKEPVAKWLLMDTNKRDIDII